MAKKKTKKKSDASAIANFFGGMLGDTVKKVGANKRRKKCAEGGMKYDPKTGECK